VAAGLAGPVTGTDRAHVGAVGDVFTVMGLDEIAAKWGTDKSSLGHDYTPTYERFLAPLRRGRVALLEIGWGSGASAAMWCEYFPNAVVAVIDQSFTTGMYPPEGLWDRVHRFRGDQADPAVVVSAAALGPFDVVIDDASHQPDRTAASFELLWRHLRPGGMYFVEDVDTPPCPDVADWAMVARSRHPYAGAQGERWGLWMARKGLL
jgi:hypothetical protein